MMSMSLLKTRRRLVVKVADSTWLAAPLEKLAAYCGGNTTLRGWSAQTAPLLDDADDAWTSPCYQSVDAAVDNRGVRPGVCSHCHNHCTACVYDCQIRYDTVEEGLAVSDLEGNLWDQHRPLNQTMTASCEAERKRGNGGRRRQGMRVARRKARVVLGGEHATDPKWPAVLLTFDRDVTNTLRAKTKAETWC